MQHPEIGLIFGAFGRARQDVDVGADAQGLDLNLLAI
jgi:hypothetical protein